MAEKRLLVAENEQIRSILLERAKDTPPVPKRQDTGERSKPIVVHQRTLSDGSVAVQRVDVVVIGDDE